MLSVPPKMLIGPAAPAALVVEVICPSDTMFSNGDEIVIEPPFAGPVVSAARPVALTVRVPSIVTDRDAVTLILPPVPAALVKATAAPLLAKESSPVWIVMF